MVEESSNVVNEERIEGFCDFFFVGEIESTLKWNPSNVNSVGAQMGLVTR